MIVFLVTMAALVLMHPVAFPRRKEREEASEEERVEREEEANRMSEYPAGIVSTESLCISLRISHIPQTKPMEIHTKSSKNVQIHPNCAQIAAKFRHLPPTNRSNLDNPPICPLYTP